MSLPDAPPPPTGPAGTAPAPRLTEEAERLAVLEAAFEAAGDGLLALGPGGVLAANRRCFDLFGVPPELRHPEAPGLLEHLRAQVGGGLALGGPGDDLLLSPRDELTSELELKDGRVLEQTWRRWFVGGEARGRLLVFKDLSPVRSSLEELARGEERFRTLFEQAAVGVGELDTASGRFVRVNRKYCAILGYTPEELGALDFMRITHPDDLAPDLALMEQLKAGTLREFELEKRLVGKDGSWVWVRLSVSPMWAPGEPPTHHIAVVQDITARVHAEEQRRVLEQQLRQAQKMEAVGTLAGGIAHDFNNLLAIVVAHLELMREDARHLRPLDESLDAVSEAAARARDLVRQILAFSRRQTPQRAVVRLAEVTAEATRLLRAALPAGVALETRLAATGTDVVGDGTQLHQVLMNLGTNAWHAIESGQGRVTVALEPVTLTAAEAAPLRLVAGAYARLRVSDTGTGMDRATLDRIYEPFFTTKRTGKGSGLGLAVVHGIVEEHHGAIAVESAPGQGTTFTVYLPASPEAAGAQARPALPAALPQGRGRVLYVDDESTLVHSTRRLLERLGFTAVGTTSPRDALQQLAAAPEAFDLVITDFTMPELSGLDVAREVRRLRPDLPVLLVTGHAERSPAELSAAGVRVRLDKPFGVAELGEAVWRALGLTP